MAMIQKIRDNSMLTMIVIGGALLAFILIDAIKPGNGVDQTDRMVGSFEGEEISLDAYDTEFKNTSYIYGQSKSLSDMTDQEKQSMAFQTWNVILRDKIVSSECELLGLEVTEQEQESMLVGEYVAPFYVYRLFGGPQTYQQNREKISSDLDGFYNYASKQTQYGPVAMSEGEARFVKSYGVKLRQQEKYLNLLKNCFYTTQSLGKDKFVAKNTTKSVKVGFVPYYLVSDSSVEVSDSDVKSAYEEIKSRFKKETESRKVVYAAFNMNYTKEDEEEVKAWANETANLFKSETNDELFVKSESELPLDNKFYKKGSIPSPILDSTIFKLSKGEVYGPYTEYIDGKTYWNVAKVMDEKMLGDSVKVSQVFFSPDKWYNEMIKDKPNPEQADIVAMFQKFQSDVDSLYELVKKNPSRFTEIAKEYSADSTSLKEGGSIGWINALSQAYPKAFVDSAMFGNKGDIKLVKNPMQNGYFFYNMLKVDEIAPRQRKLKVGVVSRAITPGDNTLNNMYNRANQVAIAIQDGKPVTSLMDSLYYYVDSATVETYSYMVNDLENARELVYWAFNEAEGERETRVFTLPTKYVVAFVKEVNEDEYLSLDVSSVQLEAKNYALRKKKFEYIQSKLGEVSAEKLANFPNEIVGATVNAEPKANVERGIPTFSHESKVLGAIAGLQAAKVSDLIQGDQGIYLVMVESVDAVEVNDDSNFDIEVAQLKNEANKSELVLREIMSNKSIVQDNRKAVRY